MAKKEDGAVLKKRRYRGVIHVLDIPVEIKSVYALAIWTWTLSWQESGYVDVELLSEHFDMTIEDVTLAVSRLVSVGLMAEIEEESVGKYLIANVKGQPS